MMSSLSPIEEREDYVLYRAGTGLCYITLVIGYLYTILTTAHLTLLNFLVFTALQVCYSVLLWGMLQTNWWDLKVWRLVLGLLLLVGITGVVGLLPLIGLQWDWLLFLVTIANFFWLLSLRSAIGAGIFLYAMAVVNVGWLNNWNWASVYASLLSLLPAFAFVAVFSLVARVLQDQKVRAERLLRRLGESNAELERAHRQLQEYASEVEELTIVRERTRLAREIHDTLGHYLSILNIQLETISKLQGRDPARAAIEITEARRVAAQSMQEVRNALAALRPTSMAKLSLTEAIAQLGNEFEHSADETALTLDLDTQLPPLSPDVQVAFYRAVQEALTNVRKHAQASKVLVRLRYEDEALELVVLDNGRGVVATDVEQQVGGFGLVGLRERMALLGGHVLYGPAEQGGYRVTARIPRVPVPGGAAPQTFLQIKQASTEGTKEERFVF